MVKLTVCNYFSVIIRIVEGSFTSLPLKRDANESDGLSYNSIFLRFWKYVRLVQVE